MRLEDELRRALREEVSGVASSEEAWRSIERRLERQTPGRRGSRVAAIALALALSTASLVGLWLGFRSDGIDREVTPGEPPDLSPRVTAVIPVGPFPQDVAVGEGAVWVSVPAQGPDEDDLIVRVDPATNEVVARIPVEDPLDDLAAGEGGIWGVGAEGSGADLTLYVARIDPVTNEVLARLPDVSGPLAVGEGSLWAVDRAGARAGPEGSSLLRIDPATNHVVATIPLGVAAWDIEVGEGYVWILPLEPGPGEGDILQVDPATNQVVTRIEIPVAGTVFAPALGEGSAWVPVCCVDNELTLVRVDVGTSRIMGEPITVEAGAPFAVAAGHVWLVDEQGALYGLNVATSEVDETVSGFEWPAGGFPDPSAELDPAQLVVWIANYQDSVTRVDLAASLGSQPDARPTPDRGTTSGVVPPGTVTASGDAVPEGRLVLQLNSGIEVLAQGDGRSVSLGGDAIVAYDVSPDASNVLAATYVTEPTNYTREDELLTIDPSTGERTVLVRAGPKEDLGPAVWSPDGQQVAYRLTVLPVDPAKQRPEGTVEQTVCIVDVATTTPECFPDLGTVDSFAWSPDGRRIAVDGVGADLPLRLLDVQSGAVSDFASPLDPDLVASLGGEPPGSLVNVDWSPSGEYVATHAHLIAAAIFDSDSRFVMLGHVTEEFSDVLSWSPTEDLLAYAIGRPPYAITDLYVLDPASGEDRLLYSTGEGEAAPIIVDAAWSPSGRWLAVAVVKRTLYLPMSVHIIDMSGGGPSSIVDLGASDADVLVGWGP